ncbi:beta-lactamase/transpeptidase-like protein [Abortiporus biennis]|nr:beta-lactamase/transpeptidase-like protein [Abortiporus biennis]
MKQALTPSVSRFVEKLMQSMRAPGVSVGVVHLHNGTVRTEFGAWGNKSEDGDPTLFNIGSCSKAFTSTALAILMDDFANHRNVTPLPPNIIEFEWHTKVKDLLPSEWGLVDEWAFKKANLRDILSHVSGLPRHEFSYGKSDTPADVTRKMKHLKPTHELREEWSYNNQMYMLASYIISRYSGKSFIDFVKERIFEPLGMTSTTYIGSEVETTGQLSQAFTLHNGTVVRRIPILAKGDFVGILAGPGGILSSTHKWLAMMLNHGVDPYTNRTIIPLRAYSEITYAHYIAFGAGFPGSSIQGYGLGWARVSYQGHETVTHSGGVPGFTTQTIIMPFDGLAVIALVNQEALVPVLAAARIVEDYLNLARSVPSDDAFLQPDISFLIQLVNTFNMMDIPGHFLTQTFFKPPSPLFEKNAKPLWGKRSLGLPLEKYAGTYFNPGYDSFTLCVPQTPSYNQSCTSDTYCSSVLSDFAKVHPTDPPSSRIGLYGSWARGWSSHIRLTHQDREAFSLSVLALFPDGFGKDKSPFSTSILGDSEIHAEFVLSEDGNTVDGLAVPEGFEYDVLFPSPGSARDLKKDAFVYFTKVN